ncbi:MAG TPA: ATP-binding cassette domain-containing protein [bacterium]
MNNNTKVIEINDLGFSYPDGKKALCGVSFHVCRGEALGIVGPNGAGKSTLLLHLNGILMNQKDKTDQTDKKDQIGVKILGLEMKQENLPKIRSKVGLVFQDPDNQLFMPTVFEDVAYGPLNMGMTRDHVLNSVERALEQVDMAGSDKRLSHHLSFGEKKRVSIATVLSMDAEILALDEPTSNLDPKHRRGLIDFLNRLTVTKIIASHDLDMILETCQRVILIDQGRIITDGLTEHVLGDKELLEQHNLEVPYQLQKKH